MPRTTPYERSFKSVAEYYSQDLEPFPEMLEWKNSSVSCLSVVQHLAQGPVMILQKKEMSSNFDFFFLTTYLFSWLSYFKSLTIPAW